MRLDAYYFGFDSTGNEDIDRVLSAVACAGKAYHHTRDWTEPIAKPYEPTHRGGTCAEWIQNAANDAATKLAAARREGVIEGRAQAEAELQSRIDAAIAREREAQSVDAAAFRLLRDEADAADAWHAETGMKVARPPHMSPATVKHIRDAEVRARSAKGGVRVGEYDSVWCGPRTRLMWNDMDSTARFYARTAQGSDTLNLIEQAQRACALEDTHSGSRREGVIEGLERALFAIQQERGNWDDTTQINGCEYWIRAEIERLKAEG